VTRARDAEAVRQWDPMSRHTRFRRVRNGAAAQRSRRANARIRNSGWPIRSPCG